MFLCYIQPIRVPAQISWVESNESGRHILLLYILEAKQLHLSIRNKCCRVSIRQILSLAKGRFSSVVSNYEMRIASPRSGMLFLVPFCFAVFYQSTVTDATHRSSNNRLLEIDMNGENDIRAFDFLVSS